MTYFSDVGCCLLSSPLLAAPSTGSNMARHLKMIFHKYFNSSLAAMKAFFFYRLLELKHTYPSLFLLTAAAKMILPFKSEADDS